jgi:hypothetical protein
MTEDRARPAATKQKVAALERWDNEGGATEKTAPEAAVESGDRLTPAEHAVLHRLGAAVVARWNGLPTDIQRALFEAASSDGAPAAADEVRAQIARFLHHHKDDATLR